MRSDSGVASYPGKQLRDRTKTNLDLRLQMRRADQPLTPETLGDLNLEAQVAWASQDIAFSGSLEETAEVLTASGVVDLCGAWGIVCRTRSVAVEL